MHSIDEKAFEAAFQYCDGFTVKSLRAFTEAYEAARAPVTDQLNYGRVATAQNSFSASVAASASRDDNPSSPANDQPVDCSDDAIKALLAPIFDRYYAQPAFQPQTGMDYAESALEVIRPFLRSTKRESAQTVQKTATALYAWLGYAESKNIDLTVREMVISGDVAYEQLYTDGCYEAFVTGFERGKEYGGDTKRESGGWQFMNTAPRDGVPFMAFDEGPDAIVIVKWLDTRFVITWDHSDCHRLSRWMPLPLIEDQPNENT